MGKTTTNSSRVGDSPHLSLRLQTLHNQYQNERHIWDIGCDHGQLGLSFKDLNAVESINLVDPSKPVIDVLYKKLKDSYISIEKVFIHLSRGQDIHPTSNSNCLFIAGMGGKEIGEIIEALLPRLSHKDRIVISPHRKILELRRLLNQLPIGLENEFVMKEDEQYYQILNLIPHGNSKKVPLYGDDIWNSEVGKEYLTHQIKAFTAHQDGLSQAYVEYLKQLNH